MAPRRSLLRRGVEGSDKSLLNRTMQSGMNPARARASSRLPSRIRTITKARYAAIVTHATSSQIRIFRRRIAPRSSSPTVAGSDFQGGGERSSPKRTPASWSGPSRILTDQKAMELAWNRPRGLMAPAERQEPLFVRDNEEAVKMAQRSRHRSTLPPINRGFSSSGLGAVHLCRPGERDLASEGRRPGLRAECLRGLRAHLVRSPTTCRVLFAALERSGLSVSRRGTRRARPPRCGDF